MDCRICSINNFVKESSKINVNQFNSYCDEFDSVNNFQKCSFDIFYNNGKNNNIF